MASAEILDFEKLLAPISEAEPTGTNLRRSDGTIDPDYDKVKAAAQDARTKERLLQQWKLARSEGETEQKKNERPEPPNWRKVQQESTKVLVEKSKDLWIAAWLIESLTRTEGFAGVRDGFRLTRELVERYWEQLFPIPGEEDDEHPIDFKLSQLAGLSGSDYEGILIAPLRGIPLLTSDEFGPLSLWDYNVATKIAAIADPEARQKRIDSTPGAKLDDFDKSVSSTASGPLLEKLQDVRAALDEFTKLNEVLATRCVDEQGESHAPPISQIRGVLAECQECLTLFLRKINPDLVDGESGGEGTSASGGAMVTGEGAAGGGGGGGGGISGRVQTREEAFRALLQVADYFRRTEPHSPVSYALEQAVRWGRLTLPDLLKELIADSNVRAEVFRRAGIPDAGESSQE